MNAPADGTAWGMCAAYGCPLFGVYGSGVGKWFCFCHHNVEPALNDAITAELHRQRATVDAILLARRTGRLDKQLEDGLIAITRGIGEQQSIPVGVVGPDHAAPHFSEIDE